MLAELYADPALRDMIPLFLSLYEEDADLFFFDVAHMLSREGSHQGCPMGTTVESVRLRVRPFAIVLFATSKFCTRLVPQRL